MNHLERWDIVFLRADDQDTTGHPAIILSNPDILTNPQYLRMNVIMGTKKPPAAHARAHQVTLNGADGLEFQTLFDCAFITTAKKSSVIRMAGRVSFTRRAPIGIKIRSSLGLG